MIEATIKKIAAECGFDSTFILDTEEFTQYQRRLQDGVLHRNGERLCGAPGKEAPWANAVLLLVQAYKPFAPGIPLSGYYIASNRAYHNMKRLAEILDGRQIKARQVYLPVRELLLRNGLGSPLKNGLTLVQPYGTRFSVQTLLLRLPEPVRYDAHTRYRDEEVNPLPPYVLCCQDCHACQNICPTGAIDQNGYHFQRCVRAYMEGEAMDRRTMEGMTAMLGCEQCQQACPLNHTVEAMMELPGAFSYEAILSGDVKPALELVGRNLNKNGRLLQHAAILAAKEGRTELMPLLEPLLQDEREAVRQAAEYAISLLRS